MHRSHQSLWPHQLSLAVLPSLLFGSLPLAVAQRTFTIRNKCDYTLWPAVTNYGTEKTQYTGVRGWEAEAGSVKELEIPSPWNGRICECFSFCTVSVIGADENLSDTGARRECDFDGNGKGSCTTGDVAGGLEVDDQTIGDVNVGEFNLDAWGGNDCESFQVRFLVAKSNLKLNFPAYSIVWDISCVPGKLLRSRARSRAQT